MNRANLLYRNLSLSIPHYELFSTILAFSTNLVPNRILGANFFPNCTFDTNLVPNLVYTKCQRLWAKT